MRPELLGLPECRLALAAAQAFNRERGRGPELPAITIQRVAYLRDDGKLTTEDVRAVAGLFDSYDDVPKPQVEDVEKEVLAEVKRRLRYAVAQAAVAEHREDEWEQVQGLMTREAALGQGEAGDGLVMSPSVIQETMARARMLTRAPYGIDGLDAEMAGGAPQGTLTCFMAGPGGAKSMCLSHIAGQLSLAKRFCAYATLELSSEEVISRIVSNQTGITIDEVKSGVADEDLYLRLRVFSPTPCVVQDFEPHITTVETIQAWVEGIGKRHGRPVDVLLLDYADKLTASGKADEKGMYAEMRVVYEKLRILCKRMNMSGITASQSRARDEKKGKVIDLEHVADSMHKARVVDQFITLNLDDDTKELTFFLAKNRYGEGRKKAGPYPTNFACGQVSPVVRAEIPKWVTHPVDAGPVRPWPSDPRIVQGVLVANTTARQGAILEDAAKALPAALEHEPGSDG